MFKVGSQVGIQNARLFNGVGTVEGHVAIGKDRPKWVPAKWKAESNEWVFVRCADGVLRRYSNGDIVKVVSLEGKSKEELRQFGVGTSVYLNGITLKGLEGTELFLKEDGTIEVIAPVGFTSSAQARIAVEYPYKERRVGGPVGDPSDDSGEED